MTESNVAKEEETQRLREALHDIAMGAGMMLQPPMKQDSVLARYAKEVKRVAEEGLGHQVHI